MSVTRWKVEELNCCFSADMVESPEGEYVLHSDYARLKAEVERLRKAGDAMACHLVCSDLPNDVCGDLMKNWTAAKEGKPSV